MTTDRSLWLAEPGRPRARTPLEADVEADVVVVGGGLSGALTALLLARDGRHVVLLEARTVGEGVTGNTSAKVTVLHGARYHQLARRFGPANARDYASAQEAGLHLVRSVVLGEGIDCHLKPVSALTYATTAPSADLLRSEAAAARRAGLPASFTTDAGLPFPVSGAVRLDDQVQLHPVQLLDGVLDAAVRRGAAVHDRSRVVALHERGGLRVTTDAGHTVRAHDVVVATHYPLFDRAGLFARVRVQREFALAAAAGDASVPGMCYGLDEGDPSVRAAGHDLVFSGGRFRPGSGTVSERLAELERQARERFPGLGPVRYRWAAQDVFPHDGLPYVGRMLPWTDRVHVATGYSAWGLTNAAAAALAVAGRVAGHRPAWATMFDPLRVLGLSGVPAMAREQAQVARHLVGDRVRPPAPPDVSSADDLEPGQGAVVRVAGHRRAAYRDEGGALHVVSARCTHLGCLVAFNDAERTWECPCHGSRFSVEGEVLSGPATRDLGARGPRVV